MTGGRGSCGQRGENHGASDFLSFFLSMVLIPPTRQSNKNGVAYLSYRLKPMISLSSNCQLLTLFQSKRRLLRNKEVCWSLIIFTSV